MSSWDEDRRTIEKWRNAPLQRPGEHVLDDTRRNRELRECSKEALHRWPVALDEIDRLQTEVLKLREALEKIDRTTGDPEKEERK